MMGVFFEEDICAKLNALVTPIRVQEASGKVYAANEKEYRGPIKPLCGLIAEVRRPSKAKRHPSKNGKCAQMRKMGMLIYSGGSDVKREIRQGKKASGKNTIY